MLRRAIPALLLAVPAHAAERDFAVASFERVRVEGPYRVEIAAGPPRARAEGDRDALDRLDVSVNGTTLVVRAGNRGWGETPAGRAAGPTVVRLSTTRLTSIATLAGATVRAARMAGPRADLSLAGAGAIEVDAIDAGELNATVIGAGTVRAAGRARRVRLLANGPGAIDAAAVRADELVVRLEGNGEVRADARYTAQVTTGGLGRVTVTGTARCTVRAAAGGPVTCGSAIAK